MLETETVADARDPDPRRVGDEKTNDGAVVFLVERAGDYLGDRGRLSWITTDVEDVGRRVSDGIRKREGLRSPSARHRRSETGEQPGSLAIESDHRLVERDVVR